jgi:hypothetical protein
MLSPVHGIQMTSNLSSTETQISMNWYMRPGGARNDLLEALSI